MTLEREAKYARGVTTPNTVARTIVGFARDEAGEHVAWLDCGHRRHIRHRPPLSSYPWIEDEAGRAAHVGAAIECGRCRQRSWPEGVEAYRSTAIFDEHSVPAGLLAEHRTRKGAWGRLEVSAGAVVLCFAAPLDERGEVEAGGWAAIPPELVHHVELRGPVKFRVVFCRRPAEPDAQAP